MNQSPSAWRSRSLPRAALPIAVMLGMFFAFGVSAFAAHVSGAHQLAGAFLGLAVASLVSMAALA